MDDGRIPASHLRQRPLADLHARGIFVVPNEYSYRNHDKKENIYDDEHNIIGSYYPREKHDDGAFRDFHLLQEAYYNTGNGDRFGLNAWLIASKRGLGRMTTDYGDPKKFINEQRERTLRSVLSWDHLRRNWKVAAKAGYIYSWFAYDYANDVGNGKLEYMTTSRNWYHTPSSRAKGSTT